MGKKYNSYFDVGLMPKDGIPGDQGPVPYPAGFYDSTVQYVRTKEEAPFVMSIGNSKYYLLEKFGITVGIDPETDTTGTWKIFDHLQYVFAEIIMANFAKLAGGIHYNNMLMSQMGFKDGLANSNYQEYAGSSGAWQPNILLDWLTGKITANNVDIRGKIDAVTGELGTLTMKAGGYIKLPPSWGSDRSGTIDNTGISLVYDGSESQSINWYSGLGTFAGEIKPDSLGYLNLSSSFGININGGSSGVVNIGNDMTWGRVNISKARLNLITSTVSVLANTNLTVYSESSLLVVTYAGDANSAIVAVYRGSSINQINPQTGDLLIILNRSSNGGDMLLRTLPGGNIKTGSANSTYKIHNNTHIVMVYFSDAWHVHTDRGQ